MTFGERLRKLRKELDLTQQKFADRIGVKRNTIATYEIGRSEPIDAVFSLICQEFHVSEKWLRTGEGEMFVPRPGDTLDAFIRERDLSPSDRILIEKFAALSEGSRQAVVEYVLSAADEILKNLAAPVVVSKNETTTPATDTAGQERTELDWRGQEIDMAEIDKKVELYRQHLLLEKEQAKRASSANGSGAV